jgi:glycosyltransferase involved in cell wall biosynthesis
VKVAFDHQIFCAQKYGGVSRYVAELACRLPAHGALDVSVIAPLFINEYLVSDRASQFTRGRYVNMPPYTFGSFSLLSAVNRVAAPVAWRGKTADILHETYYATKPIGDARRRVVTVHDMVHELFSEEFPDATRVTAAKRAAIDRASHIICVSATTQRDLVQLYGVDPARTSVVHHGYSTTTEGNTAGGHTSERKPSLLYVGHRGGYKNFSTLLRAYGSSSILQEFELVAFGGGPFTPSEQEEIQRLGISRRVRFESGSDQKLAKCYQKAAAFIYPSKYEGFGLPPLEAMSHGCPVVCSNAGSIPEVVGDAGYYFDPASSDDLRIALEQVVTTDALRSDLRKLGYARVATFSWDKCAAATARIYREIL